MTRDTDRYYRTARQALKCWAFQVDTLELVSRSENVVFKCVTKAGSSYALRIHRPGYNSLAELHSELVWSKALRDAGINTPSHTPTRDGRDYAEVALEGTDQLHQVGVIEWFAGDSLAHLIEHGDRNAGESYFTQIGETMAHIHNQAGAWTPPPGFVRRAWNAPGLVGPEPLWGKFWQLPQLDVEQAQLLQETRQVIFDVLVEYGESPAFYGLMHADLHPHNILVDRGRVQVIDFDDCGLGWHAYDVAVALYNYRDVDEFPRWRDALFDGYAGVRSLDQSLIDMLPLFFLVRSLVSLGWIHARPELANEKDMREGIVSAVRQARAYLQRHHP